MMRGFFLLPNLRTYGRSIRHLFSESLSLTVKVRSSRIIIKKNTINSAPKTHQSRSASPFSSI